jgi:hypothetical protein
MIFKGFSYSGDLVVVARDGKVLDLIPSIATKLKVK